jgi:hypothetical protein
MGDNGDYLDKGMMGTTTEMMFVDRYIYLREGLREIVQRVRSEHPDKTLRVGIESPIFNDLYSEGMYGLFLYSNEALMLERVDTVYLSPNQVKAHAALFLNRPKGWKMQKGDMVEAVKQATQGQGAKRWNHHQAELSISRPLRNTSRERRQGVLSAWGLPTKKMTAISSGQIWNLNVLSAL